MKQKLLHVAFFSFVLSASTTLFGQQDASLAFDGIGDQVNLGNSMNAILDPINEFTAEAWVYPTTTSGFGVIVGNYNTTVANNEMQFLLRRSGAVYEFFVNDGAGYQSVATAPASVSINTWQHVAGTWDGSEIKIYLDGVLANTTAGITGPSFATTSNYVSIGNNIINEAYTGNIDNVRLWTVARSESLLQDYMNCAVTDSAVGLLAHYNFNDGLADDVNTTNTTLHNIAGVAYHGTLQNFALTGSTSNFTLDYNSNYLSLRSSIGSLANADRLYNGVAIDYENDGDNDVLVTANNGETRLYTNNGNGNFTGPTVIIAPFGFPVYAAGDLDNDGDDDFIYGSNATATVYVNNGSGVFTTLPTNFFNGTGAASIITIADMNGDGMMDFIFGNSQTSITAETEVWLNIGTTGSPDFSFSAGLGNGGGVRNSIAVGDIDNDGDVDIVTGASSYAALVFLNNANDGTFPPGVAPTGYGGGVKLVDWNQDGDLDYVNYDAYNNYGFVVRLNDGTGTFLDPNQLFIANGTNEVDLADMNGDGFLDAVGNIFGGHSRFYVNNGCDLLLQTDCNYTLDFSDNGVVLADYNNDGTTDIFNMGRNHLSTFHMNYLDTVITPPLSTIIATVDPTICSGETADLEATASNFGTLDWFVNVTGGVSLGLGTTFTTVPLTSDTSYFVQTINPNGCPSERVEVFVTVNDNPLVIINGAGLICEGGSLDLTASGASAFVWQTNDANDGSTSATITAMPAGIGAETYTVIGTENGCDNSYAVIVNVVSCVGIDETSPLVISVYPNPASEFITMQVSATNNQTTYELIDYSGRIVLSGFINSTNQSINLNGLEAGIYMLRLSDNGSILYSNSIVKK